MSEREQRWTRPFELDPATAQVTPEEPALPAAPEPEADILPPPRGSRFWGRLATLGLVAAVGAVALYTVEQLLWRIAAEPLIGWPLAILTAMVAVAALGVVGREFVQLRRLQRRSGFRVRAQRLADSELHGAAQPLIGQVRAGLADDPIVTRALQAFDHHADDVLADGERLRLFERTVLEPVDRRAFRIVMQSSRDIGLLTAISPYGLLDGLLVLWRTTLMVRAIARLYGVAPGPVATAALLRRCLRNAALAGIADVAAHAVLEHAGASLAAMLSSRAGQGAGNALLAARLGIEAVRETRPLPFVATRPPALRDVRNAILGDERDRRAAAAGASRP